MASSSGSSVTSYSASSSAVTIPIPGKSILKRPPPPQQSFFSLARLSKLLPNQPQATPASDVGDEKTLKRAHFILPQLVTVYPISAANPPSTPNIKEEKRSVEQREAERRRRVVRGNSCGPGPEDAEEWWNMEKVESFYRECCDSREENPLQPVSAAFKQAAGTSPRTVDLSGVQLTFNTASILSDVFAIEWGLRKLVFRECDLDEQILKPMLHALLIPASLQFLSVALNRRLKTSAYRLIGAYVSKAKSLQFLDLSQNPLEKKAIEYIAAALVQAPAQGLESLRLDDCSLKPAALDALAHVVRTSSLRNISLRHNRITAAGTVAIALMIKDYPDIVPASNPGSVPPSPTSSLSPLPTSPPPTSSAFANTSMARSPNGSVSSLPGLPNASPALLPPPTRSGPVLPPPRHPSTGPQTTYTPYVPRARKLAAQAAARGGHPEANPLSPGGQHIPIITSSSQGGVTTRHPVPPPAVSSPTLGHRSHADQGPSAALMDKVRALHALPRLGELRTLDLKGNDIRGGITYIAQVLKRNRTLKVLNLSENKLDVQGLVVLAEALKYNSCLETLDLSRNPCCGPTLEGIQSLRTAFTLNSALKQLFLTSTGLTPAGAIALAEFLPESSSLLHLGLTENALDLASVMALSSGLKANHVMRCLDLTIPPNDEQMAGVCRNIFNWCVRNTEEAEKATREVTDEDGPGDREVGKGVWGMIEKSQLAKTIRQDDRKKNGGDLVEQARACKEEMETTLSETISPTTIAELDPELAKRASGFSQKLGTLIQTTQDPARMQELLELNDALTDLLARTSAPTPVLHGLGLEFTGSPIARIRPVLSIDALLHGHSNSDGHAEPGADDTDEEMDQTPTTPKVDKGKAKAEPEPVEPEKVLSPTFLINSEDDDSDAQPHSPQTEDEEDVLSPSSTDRSRSWVEEEGEVFRKSNVLLGPEEMEGDYDGEELRVELLEAMVERPPPRPIVDEFGLEVGAPKTEPEPTSQPSSPVITEEPGKSAPRPYVPRRRSSQASISSVSSTGSAHSSNGTIKSPTSPMLSSPLSPSISSPTGSILSRPPLLARLSASALGGRSGDGENSATSSPILSPMSPRAFVPRG